MRTFTQLNCNFWTSTTGRAIRKRGPFAQIVALYLISCSHSTFIGIYHLPLAYAVSDLGLTVDQLSEALAGLQAVGFAKYDEKHEIVFVVNTAQWNLAGKEKMSERDGRTTASIREYSAIPDDCPLKHEFFARYGGAYFLPNANRMAA